MLVPESSHSTPGGKNQASLLLLHPCPIWRDCVLSRFSGVRLFATLRTIARQAPLSLERQWYKMGCHALLQGISQPRDWTHVSCIAGRFFTHLGSLYEEIKYRHSSAISSPKNTRTLWPFNSPQCGTGASLCFTSLVTPPKAAWGHLVPSASWEHDSQVPAQSWPLHKLGVLEPTRGTASAFSWM